ncbi:MAG: hypothetical protein FWC54_05140 [Actinomycetia bacterium]|nr:hypothetical protein [Actinomycetes bacterium]
MRTTHITLNLNARLQPMHRGEYFEDAIDEKLSKARIGKIDGGGTLMSKSGEVDNCDIEITLSGSPKKSLPKLLSILESVPIPKGSKLLIADRSPLGIGDKEGLALYLNGTKLPDDVYATCDINLVVEKTGELLGEKGCLLSYWEGPEDTALYFYGDSFDEMNSLIKPFLESYPLCQKCRVKRIA